MEERRKDWITEKVNKIIQTEGEKTGKLEKDRM